MSTGGAPRGDPRSGRIGDGVATRRPWGPERELGAARPATPPDDPQPPSRAGGGGPKAVAGPRAPRQSDAPVGRGSGCATHRRRQALPADVDWLTGPRPGRRRRGVGSGALPLGLTRRPACPPEPPSSWTSWSPVGRRRAAVANRPSGSLPDLQPFYDLSGSKVCHFCWLPTGNSDPK